MLLNIDVPAVAELTVDPQRALDMARTIVIDGPDMFEIAAEELSEIKSRSGALETRRKAITVPIDDAKKKVMDLFRPAVEFYAEAEKIIKGAMVVYQNKVQAERDAEEAKLREAAAAERKALQEKAAALEAAGKHEEAAVAEATSMVVSAPAPATEAPKAQGVSFRENWSARVVDVVALCAFVVENPDQSDLVTGAQKALDGLAKARKGNLHIPGVEAFCERIVSSRGRG